MLRAHRFDVRIKMTEVHLESKTDVVPFPELLREPTNTREFFSREAFVTSHQGSAPSNVSRNSDSVLELLVEGDTIPIGDIMGVDSLLPGTFRALTTGRGLLGHRNLVGHHGEGVVRDYDRCPRRGDLETPFDGCRDVLPLRRFLNETGESE